MRKLLCIIMLFASSSLFAQTPPRSECATTEMDTTEFKNLPWHGNNDMLETFLDSLGYPPSGAGLRIVGSPQVRYWIPISFGFTGMTMVAGAQTMCKYSDC